MPGIPFQKEYFEFCKIGLIGGPTKVKDPDGSWREISATDHTHMLGQQAFSLSNIVKSYRFGLNCSEAKAGFVQLRRLSKTIFIHGRLIPILAKSNIRLKLLVSESVCLRSSV